MQTYYQSTVSSTFQVLIDPNTLGNTQNLHSRSQLSRPRNTTNKKHNSLATLINCLIIFILLTGLCSEHTSDTTQKVSLLTSAANCSNIAVPYFDFSSKRSSMYSVGSICLKILKSWRVSWIATSTAFS